MYKPWNKNKEDKWQGENNVRQPKSKESNIGYIKVTLEKCMYVEKDQNRNNDCNKPDLKASSKQNNRNDSSTSPYYEDQQNWQRNSKERQNWNKNDSLPNNERNKWKQNKSSGNDLERKVDWNSVNNNNNNNNNYSSRKSSSPQNLNDKKDLIFDKRDFLYGDVPKKVRANIQLDEVAQYSVTDMRTSDEISNFIAKLDGLNKDNIVITDGTACVGGNTFSFCKKFKKVQAVELDRNRYEMLRYNLTILGCTNTEYHHANYLELLNNLNQDIVFLDPPWGGPSYKDKDEVDLFLGGVPLDEICEKLKSTTKYIIIKAPLNLNYEKFKAKISGNLQRHYNFRKMLLIVVDYYHPSETVQREPITNGSSKNADKTNEKENKSRNKETCKNHSADAGSEKTTDKSTYADIAAAAANDAVIFCDDYECPPYAYQHAYDAALAAASAGGNAACVAANAAYISATEDIARANGYADSRDAGDYLACVSTHNYYVVAGAKAVEVYNGVNNVKSINRTNGAEGARSAECSDDVHKVEDVEDSDGTNGVEDFDGGYSAEDAEGPDDANSAEGAEASDGVNSAEGAHGAEGPDGGPGAESPDGANSAEGPDDANDAEGSDCAKGPHGAEGTDRNYSTDHLDAASKAYISDEEF